MGYPDTMIQIERDDRTGRITDAFIVDGEHLVHLPVTALEYVHESPNVNGTLKLSFPGNKVVFK